VSCGCLLDNPTTAATTSSSVGRYSAATPDTFRFTHIAIALHLQKGIQTVNRKIIIFGDDRKTFNPNLALKMPSAHARVFQIFSSEPSQIFQLPKQESVSASAVGITLSKN